MRTLSESYGDIVGAVRAFNDGLAEDHELENQLSYFRAWYYIPEIDMVGPSKFIGYKGMTAAEYMSSSELDGKVTEPALSRWFTVRLPGTPEASHIEDLVERLLARYGKTMNRKARFLAPSQWRLGDGQAATSRGGVVGKESDGGARPIVEVFWRAFLGLYPEDQEALARRIDAHANRSR